jgi:hypothetical protein
MSARSVEVAIMRREYIRRASIATDGSPSLQQGQVHARQRPGHASGEHDLIQGELADVDHYTGRDPAEDEPRHLRTRF